MPDSPTPHHDQAVPRGTDPAPKRGLSTAAKAALITIPAVFVIFLVIILIALFSRSGAQNAASESAPVGGGTPVIREDTRLLDDAGPDAPTLVEFLDFECEACSALHPVIEDIRADYAGRITVAVRYFPIPGHLNSMTSAVAVEAAAQQGEFEPMYRKMFATQAEWGEKQESEAPRFRGFAEELGLDMAAYDAAVADPMTEARVAADFEAGQALGVQGTPTFFIDGERLQPTQVSDITGALDAALAARE